MLTNLRNKINALRSFDFDKEQRTIIDANKDKLADLQAEQLAQGLKSDGSRITPGYSAFTIQDKKANGTGLGAVTDRVTFFKTGELYRKLRADIQGSTFAIRADTFKFHKAIDRSGVNVVGLSRDSKEKFVLTYTRPGLLKAYEQKVTNS